MAFPLFVIAQKEEKPFLIDISTSANGRIINCRDSVKHHIIKDFILPQNQEAKYRIEIFEDSVSYLWHWQKNHWNMVDVLSENTWFMSDDACNINMPGFELVDFNKDGFCDLTVWILTNVNGNRWTKLFLYDPVKKELVILRNRAEGGIIWDAPEYYPKDSTIHCVRLSGVYGVSFTSKYKLKRGVAVPVEKDLSDTNYVNRYGKGSLRKYYNGKGLLWNLIKTEIE